ncbi:MFS transporter [Rhizobium laguerreae]|uniref:MFS transporter n=1 Tax=Rhizobium laguerreae TaxID=1076926 RepID=UPI00103C267C|nr:MFS transporter [Rhizobium laguerreae]TBY10371.1 MFS transporter [Rhizobium laguerreae]
MSQLPSGSKLLFLSVLSAASAYTADISIFPIILASLSREFGINTANSVLLAYSYNIALIAGIVPSYFARTPRVLLTLFRLGLVLFCAGAVLLFSSDTFSGLLSARILMGLGAGIFSPLIPSIISVMYKEKTKYLSYWATTTGAVCVIAPLALMVAAQIFALRSSVILIVLLSILAFFLAGKSIVTASERASTTEVSGSPTISWPGLLSVLVTVFVIYGQLTWLIYSIPLRAAHAGASDTYLALLGTLPWVSFTIVCYVMSRVASIYFPQCLMVSAILAGVGLIIFVNMPTDSTSSLFLVMFIAGAAMAVANIPSTALAFSYVDASRFGLISCLDILAARLGGAFYLSQFDWASPGVEILWSGIPLVLSLAFILIPQRELK